MRQLVVQREIAKLIRLAHKNSPGDEPQPHELRQSLEATVWQYLNDCVPTKEAALDWIWQIGVQTDRLPPQGAGLFSPHTTKGSQDAPTDAHRMLGSWLMALA